MPLLRRKPPRKHLRIHLGKFLWSCLMLNPHKILRLWVTLMRRAMALPAVIYLDRKTEIPLSWFVFVFVLTVRQREIEFTLLSLQLYTIFMTQTGWCQKKGKLGFHQRYCTLTADGKLYSARNDQTTKKKHMINLGETTTFNPSRRSDLIIKGHNTKEFVNGFSRYS